MVATCRFIIFSFHFECNIVGVYDYKSLPYPRESIAIIATSNEALLTVILIANIHLIF